MDAVNADQLTRRLIDEGARLLADQGISALSLRRLAAAAETSTMAVYTRFGDKQGLLNAMHREGFRRLGDRVVEASQSTRPLLDVGRAYRLAALESPHLYGLMFGPLPTGFMPSTDNDKAADATFTPLVDAVRHAVERRDLAGDPEHIAVHLWVVAHGMVSLEISGQLPGRPDEASDRYDDALELAVQPFLPSS